jgi:hypothetical protein
VTHTVPADARASLAAWLDCDECTREQLETVVALGPDAVPILAATLREGLAPASRARLEEQLRELHAARLERARRNPEEGPRLDERSFVAYHVANRESLHRSRAATALGRIGTEPARLALREALSAGHRPSVVQSVRDALDE